MTAENERLKIEAAREAEKAKIEAEKAKVEAEKEIEMAKISAQRESETEARRNEIEAKRLEIENQLQVRRLESEVIRSSEHRGINGGMKTLKLPTFNEDKDDLDAYLNRFERACQAYAVKPDTTSAFVARTCA